MSNDFDNDFDDFNDDSFDDFKSSPSLKEIWQNNPILKMVVVAVGVVLFIILLFILLSEDEVNRSNVGYTPNQSEAPGGEVSQAYADAIISVNENRTEQALANPDVSSVPIPYNLEDQDLLTEVDDGPPFDDFDPLAAWRQQAQPEVPTMEEDPVLAPYEGPIQPQPVPGPSPEVVGALAQAMSEQMNIVLDERTIDSAKIMQVTPEDFLTRGLATNGIEGIPVDTDGDGIPDTIFAEGPGEEEDIIVENIILPAGTVNYAQILTEASSDVPGPVLAQLVSGPLAGARLIGGFESTEDYLILTFNAIVIDGINMGIEATAIDPATTLPGVATEVDKRYFTRVILPAAGRFIEGVGRAIAQESQTVVSVNGDTVTSSQEDLDLEQELGRGVEEASQQIADFMEEESDKVQPLVRVARGTAIGVFFTQPVVEGQ